MVRHLFYVVQYREFFFNSRNALISCFPVGRPPGQPRRTHGNPGGIVQFVISFFPAGKGSCLVLETTYLYHRDIPPGFVCVLVSGISLLTKVFVRHFISFRCQASILCCQCSYFPLRRGCLSFVLCPLPRGFEWFLFVTKNNSPRVSRGSTHGEANDKCIMIAKIDSGMLTL